MFGLSRTQKNPLADRKSAERWLAAFSGNDPLAMHSEIVTELGHISERTARRNPAALEAVFFIDAHTENLRRALTAQYIEHASRSSRIENQLWSALFDMTQAFLLAYQAFSREVSDHAQSNKWQALLPELIGRQVAHLALDGRIRLYRYEQWIPAKWAELHTLFTVACSRQLERTALTLQADEEATTIEQEFLKALLLQLMNAGNLTPRRLEWVHGELAAWCAPLRLTVESSSLTSFYVDLGSREGLKRRSSALPEGRVLFLDTRPLHLTLLQNANAVEQKIRQQPLSERTPKRTEQLNLLNKLAAQVDPEFKPFARRGERTAAVGSVDAIVGFAKIAAFLREEERGTVVQADTAKSFGSTMELAVFGRTRNEPDRQQELARQRLGRHAAPGGPWDVKDVSQTGFRLIAPMSVANSVMLGTLAAIRPIGQTEWTLGIVRRMRRLTIDRAEIGLQVIANTVSGVDLIEHAKVTLDDYSVNGEPTVAGERVFQGLFLVMRKRDREAPVQSVVIPANEYQPTRRFKVVTASSIHPIRFGRLIEQMADWVWTTIEPMGIDTVLPFGNTPTAPAVPDGSTASAA
jgi:hypothetical protein